MSKDPAELWATAETIVEERNKGKRKSFIQRFMAQRKYFMRLFPAIKEQKPGIDLYFPITFIQFLLIFYCLFFNSSLDGKSKKDLESSDVYSMVMIYLVLIQAVVVIIDRYISRTYTRIAIRKIG
mmetsp:Transcript_21761/g.16100  ORF Transcript_21761/g.16100 Transcript_21761/m.16100 type:complete len:125 (+) Transcript_21761:624-998(+)